jgi:hypothetical protein
MKKQTFLGQVNYLFYQKNIFSWELGSTFIGYTPSGKFLFLEICMSYFALPNRISLAAKRLAFGIGIFLDKDFRWILDFYFIG